MRTLVITLLVAAAVAAPPAFAQLPPVGGGPLPEPPPVDVPLPPIETPDLPALPPLPDATLPDVQLPVPTPTPPAVRPPVQVVPTPATAKPSAGGSSRAPSPRGSEGGGARATGGPSQRATVRGGSRRSRGSARRRATAETRTAATRPASTRPASTPTTLIRTAGTRSSGTRAPARASEPGTAARLAGDLGELLRAMPPAVLWALLGIAAIALGLAGNAFWQSHQRAGLEAQRAELLDDIGLLSSALLPVVPEALNGLSVTAAYRPAEGPAAGGDFYDVFALDDQRIGVLLGDVSGHGRRSVTQAALARYTLRTLLAAGHAPGDALARADELLIRDLRPDFVTVIAAVYDCGTAELTYAKAGHEPPIVLGTAHDPAAERPAPPIGLGVGDVWPEYRLQLSAGVSVCLFTDGLEDACLEGTRIGRDQVVRLFGAHESPDASRLLDDVNELADQMSDDTAAVVLSHR